jgi:iron complex transport system substrate-binding protein
MKKLTVFGIAALIIFSICALSVGAEEITVVDMGKRTVTLKTNPSRIIALGPGSLRQVVYLGATSKVVGVEEFEKTRLSGRPYILAYPELTKLPVIGPGGPAGTNKEPDLEAVLRVNPDVIFVSYMDPVNADAMQKKLGIPVVILTHGRFASFDELLYDSLRVAGKVLGAEDRANAVINFIESSRKDLSRRVATASDSKDKSVYVGAIGFKGSQAIESSDGSYTPLEWLGANNLAKKISPKDHVFVDREKLLEWNPDIIFIDAGGLSLVEQDYQRKPEYYSGLEAFRSKNVFVVYPFNYYVTNVSTAIADSYAIGKILHPGKFEDIDLKTKTDDIFTFFYGKSVYYSMEKDFGSLGSVPEFVNRPK